MRGVNAWRGRPLCLALGVFDGVHLGHREVIRATVKMSQGRNVIPAVLTFDPHPSALVDPRGAPPLLTTTDEKLELLKRLGVAMTVVVEFDQALAGMSPRRFVEETLVERLRVQCVVIGGAWRFGANGAGTPALLRRLGSELGFSVAMAPQVMVNGRKVSSTRIRELLLRGRIQAANELLGQPYSLEGLVIPGDGLGTELGFPTANLQLPAGKLIPADGIYACWAGVKRLWASVAYIGARPTFGDSRERRVEIHLVEHGLRVALLKRWVKAEFVERLRNDRRFATREDLICQIRSDCDDAWRLLKQERLREPSEQAGD
jgi:riboflavin kinase/FMN adenylyltransferase